VRGRFAPSPTGDLHLGNARTALLAWASARAQGGHFVLRVEDLDTARTVEPAREGNLAELRWLGLEWDEGPDVGGPHGPYVQSQRHQHYADAVAALAAAGLVGECFLSRADLQGAASAPHGPSGPVYGTRERQASERVADRRRAEGRSPSLRFRPPAGVEAVSDVLAGPRVVDVAGEVGDIVVRRADGLFAYALAVVVDDAAMAIDEVVRGDDLWPVTPAQVALGRALGLPTPRYLHVPLLLDAGGARLAKRRGDGTLAVLMAAGVAPAKLRGALLASTGLLAHPRPLSPRDVVAAFDPHRLAREAARWTADHDAWLRAP
jgi:glutamyl-tRNA synthetase